MMHMIYAFFLLIHRLQAPNLSESRSCSSFHNKNLVKHGVQIQLGILAYNTNINTLSIREPCRNLFHLKPIIAKTKSTFLQNEKYIFQDFQPFPAWLFDNRLIAA